MDSKSPRNDERMRESVESWEVLSVPSTSGQENDFTSTSVTISQLAAKRNKNASMERLLMEAQRESRQNSARQSRFQSNRSSPVFPDSPLECEESYLSYDDFARKMLASPSAADGSTDWFWDWHYYMNSPKVAQVRFPRRKQSKIKRRLVGLIVLTNILALLLGAGLGYYLSKRIQPDDLFLDEWELLPVSEFFRYS